MHFHRLHECPNSTWTTAKSAPAHARRVADTSTVSASEISFHISPTGDDGNAGDAQAPFRSPMRARDAIRAARKVESPGTWGSAPPPATVVVHNGTYLLGDAGGTLTLSAEDSFTQWVAAPGAAPVFAGAVNLSNLTWSASSMRREVLQADVSHVSGWGGVSTLFDGDGRRLIRARTPNGDPEGVTGLCFKVPGVSGLTVCACACVFGCCRVAGRKASLGGVRGLHGGGKEPGQVPGQHAQGQPTTTPSLTLQTLAPHPHHHPPQGDKFLHHARRGGGRRRHLPPVPRARAGPTPWVPPRPHTRNLQPGTPRVVTMSKLSTKH